MSKQLPLYVLSELTAISPLDGRYHSETVSLSPFVSEYSLIKTRIEVEAKYLIALSEIKAIRLFTLDEKQMLLSFATDLSLEEATKVKEIEDTTKHDVKAMERVFRQKLTDTSLSDVTEMVHFGLTSEDVNNLSYRLMLTRATQNIMLPTIDRITESLVAIADAQKRIPMLARTHGQAAIPTTLGKEIVNVAIRLNEQTRNLEKQKLKGKLNGAIGNFNALQVAIPDVDWIQFSEDFITSLGLSVQPFTTQINPYDDVVEYLQHYQRINNILIDFDQDMWRYISDYWFAQELKKEEVGSSTMPQKINPIRFENSEGNLGIANAIIEHFTRKLPISRLQRDLSDSTVIRNTGAILAHSLISYHATSDGLSRVKPNFSQISYDLEKDWSILAEAAQTILRKEGVEDPYSLLKSLTRGEHVNQKQWQEIIVGLPIEQSIKDTLIKLTPTTYIGLAVKLVDLAIKTIASTRKK